MNLEITDIEASVGSECTPEKWGENARVTGHRVNFTVCDILAEILPHRAIRWTIRQSGWNCFHVFFFLLLKIFVLRVLDTRCACTCVYVCVRRNACEHVWRGTIVHLFVCLPAHICAYLILASLPSSRPCFLVVFNDAYHSSYCSCNYDSAPIKTVIVPLFNRCLLLNRRHRIITLYL